jgi:hypothetical protein
MIYVSEFQGENTLPLLFKGRVGEGLRKKSQSDGFNKPKKMCIKGSFV